MFCFYVCWNMSLLTKNCRIRLFLFSRTDENVSDLTESIYEDHFTSPASLGFRSGLWLGHSNNVLSSAFCIFKIILKKKSEKIILLCCLLWLTKTSLCLLGLFRLNFWQVPYWERWIKNSFARHTKISSKDSCSRPWPSSAFMCCNLCAISVHRFVCAASQPGLAPNCWRMLCYLAAASWLDWHRVLPCQSLDCPCSCFLFKHGSPVIQFVVTSFSLGR